MDTPPRTDRSALEQTWLDLTRRRLPAAAGPRGWPIHADHCMQRVLLDHACGGVWYDHIPRRPAYRHAPEAVLARAVATGEAVLDGKADLRRLNAQSLAWRAARRRAQPSLANTRSRDSTSPRST